MTSSSVQLAVYDPNVTPVNASCGGPAGLLGLYWTNQTSANAFTGAPTWTNTDATVNFNYGTSGFNTSILARGHKQLYRPLVWEGPSAIQQSNLHVLR